MCIFEEAWVGKCKQEPENDFCKDHIDKECCSCGKQATHSCEETNGGFVCGALLCEDCEHTLCENGCNGGAPRPQGLKPHCRKIEQVYLPWYHPDFKEKG